VAEEAAAAAVAENRSIVERMRARVRRLRERKVWWVV
jgi:hypothetical protein